MSKPKSANTAGLLGIFTGFAGGHEWYLGRPMRALLHVGVSVLAIVCFIVSAAIFYSNRLAVATGILPSNASVWAYIGLTIFVLGALWSAVEGFIFLIQGEAGLARRGLAVLDPAARPTLSPKAKQRILLFSGIGVGGILLIIMLTVLISSITRIDYGEAYRIAKDLHTHVRELYDDTKCHNVMAYVDSTSTSEKTYASYLETCREFITDDNQLVDKLGQTAAIRRNSELQEKYTIFREAYLKAIPDNSEFEKSLKIYETMHNFYLATAGLNAESSAKQISAAADVLKNSSSAELQEFGAEWEKYYNAYAAAYKAYQDDPEANKDSDLYTAMTKARTEYQDWLDDAASDLNKLADLSLSDTSTMYRAFRNLNDLIRDTYAENYNYGSGDCSENVSTGKVYCS